MIAMFRNFNDTARSPGFIKKVAHFTLKTNKKYHEKIKFLQRYWQIGQKINRLKGG